MILVLFGYIFVSNLPLLKPFPSPFQPNQFANKATDRHFTFLVMYGPIIPVRELILFPWNRFKLINEFHWSFSNNLLTNRLSWQPRRIVTVRVMTPCFCAVLAHCALQKRTSCFDTTPDGNRHSNVAMLPLICFVRLTWILCKYASCRNHHERSCYD